MKRITDCGLRIADLRTARSAFTLLELLLVVVIIGILAAAVIPNLAGKSQQARIATARSDISGALATALDSYEQSTGSYPTTSQGLNALISAPSGVQNWQGPYIKPPVLPQDPWGHDYVYKFPGSRFPTMYELLSAGPDGKAGTDDDITETPERKAQ